MNRLRLCCRYAKSSTRCLSTQRLVPKIYFAQFSLPMYLDLRLRNPKSSESKCQKSTFTNTKANATTTTATSTDINANSNASTNTSTSSTGDKKQASNHLPSLPSTIKQILSFQKVGSTVEINGWVKNYRKQKRVSFIQVSDGSGFDGIQIVVGQEQLHLIPAELSLGSAIKVKGDLIDSPGKNQPLELVASEIRLVGKVEANYPFQKKYQTVEYARGFEHLRPKLDLFKSISRVRSEAAKQIHKFYQDNNFIQIHTPVLTSNDCEGGSETFEVMPASSGGCDSEDLAQAQGAKEPFFGKSVNLSVSGQLHLEAASSAHSRVYNFNPVFRAESSMTSRHLSEFWMVEAEVSFIDSINQLMDLAEASVCIPIQNVVKTLPQDIEYLQSKADSLFKDLKWSIFDYGSSNKPFARITYSEAIEILSKSLLDSKFKLKPKPTFQFKPEWGQPLQTEHELFLANKYFERPVFVYNYPKSAKPFYMKTNRKDTSQDHNQLQNQHQHRDHDQGLDQGQSQDLRTVGCFDLLVPGLAELVGGSLREDNYDILAMSIKKLYPADTADITSDPSSTSGPSLDKTSNLNVDVDVYSGRHININGTASALGSDVDLHSLQWYLDLRKYGGAPHGGYGLGFDRFVQLLTSTKSIRDVAIFPRYSGHCST